MRVRPRLREAWARLRGGELTPKRAAWSVAVGLAIGVTPLWGVHWAIVLAVCVPLELDAAVAFLASNVSLPFIAPFLTFAEIEIGAWLRTGRALPLDVDAVRASGVGAFVGELALGTVVLAIALAALGFAVTYGLTTWKRRRAKRA
jgi:uncharacterized protein (DUF2062 family)